MEEAKDNREKNGGARPGSGRPKDSGVPSQNKVVRLPKALKEDLESKGVTNITQFLIEASALKLSMMDVLKKAREEGITDMFEICKLLIELKNGSDQKESTFRKKGKVA